MMSGEFRKQLLSCEEFSSLRRVFVLFKKVTLRYFFVIIFVKKYFRVNLDTSRCGMSEP